MTDAFWIALFAFLTVFVQAVVAAVERRKSIRDAAVQSASVIEGLQATIKNGNGSAKHDDKVAKKG